MLTIPEQLLLIFIDDARGRIISPDALPIGLAGAVLADLSIQKKIELKEGRIKTSTDLPTGNDILDKGMKMILAEKQQKKPKYWLAVMGDKKIIRRVASSLVINNLLLLNERRYVLIIPYQAYPQYDASAKYWVKRNLRATIFGGEPLEIQNLILLNLLKSVNLLNMVFTPGERKAAHKKLEELSYPQETDEGLVKILTTICKGVEEVADGEANN